MQLQDATEEDRYQQVQQIDLASEEAVSLLGQALYDPGWRVRRRAAQRLAAAGRHPQTVPFLLSVLGNRGQTGARNAAAEALIAIGSPAVPSLIGLLAHPDPDQRKFAADILGPIGDPSASAALIAGVEDEDPNVRLSAVEALGQVGGPGAPRALEKCLAGDDALLKLGAVEALERLGVPPPLPVLAGLMHEPSLRRAAVRILGLVRQPSALREIARALGAEARSVREAALAALGLQLDPPDPAWATEVEREVRPPLRREPAAAAWLEEGLRAEDLQVRRGALFCLSLLGEPSLALTVAKAAEDDLLAEDVLSALLRMGPAAARALALEAEQLGAPSRQVAAEAIAQRADASFIPALERLLRSPEAELRQCAVVALGRCGAPEAMGPLAFALEDAALAQPAALALVQLASSFPLQVREVLVAAAASGRAPAALRALAQVDGGGALLAVRGASRHADPGQRAAAAQAAGEVGGEASIQFLRAGLADEDSRVRAASAKALGRVPAHQAAPLLRGALNDPDPDIQAAAVEAAAECGATELVPKLNALAQGSDPRLGTLALKALAALGRLDGATLERAAVHPDPEVARQALLLGATLPEGVALARRLLAHGRWELRTAAARVLGASGGPGDLPLVQAALEAEEDRLVREALEWARAQLCRR